MRRQRRESLATDGENLANRTLGPADLLASQTFQSLFAIATTSLEAGEMVGFLAVADWLEDQGDLLLADCLRQSLMDPKPVALPHGHLAAWQPINQIQGGLLACRGIRALREGMNKGTPGLGLLQVLDLSQQNLTGEALTALFQKTNLPALVTLNLRGNPLGDSGAMELARIAGLTGIRHLSLWSCHIGPEGARILALANSLPHLKILNLRNNPLELAGARQLLGSECLTSIRTLVLQRTGLADGPLQVKQREPGWPELRELNLADNRIGSEGLGSLGRSRALAGLKHLDVRNNLIRSQGAKTLTEASHLSSLERLDLRGNRIGPGGGRVLVRLALPNLRELDLRNNMVGKNAANLLKASPLAARQIRVRLDNNPLRARLPLGLRPRQTNSLVARTWRRFRNWLGSGSE